MVFDALSLQTASALVILVSAVMYLLDTLMLRDALPGRLWAGGVPPRLLSARFYLVLRPGPGSVFRSVLGARALVARARSI